ncbi:agamous-like mads-box protein agl61 [Phtheirospermum japonicum]|uniref:Agamous-like mads-box protein agl61 n=1 Tax=Phtheirospermum japonicum TaxID=374723 RepID=A0A830B9S3_9LAMI|nr:agamous-like mads-box protein agl61 [Phtheirospermum japonicum]
MKLIADEKVRTVTFSKRRARLFEKATELSILCGAHIDIIIFPLGGLAYSFGHPNVESVVGLLTGNRCQICRTRPMARGLLCYQKLHSIAINYTRFCTKTLSYNIPYFIHLIFVFII